MNKFLIIIIVLGVASFGFLYYINSGEELNEALPFEVELTSEDREHIVDMIDTADTMSPEEKKEAEEKIVSMLMEAKPKELQKSKVTEQQSTTQTALLSGTFTEIDLIHKGSGNALVFDTTTDSPLLRLQDFQVTRGPDLYVYLSKNTNIKANGLGEWTSLGRLKSSKGNQNYPLPENFREYNSVVIWCQAFGVLFSDASLR